MPFGFLNDTMIFFPWQVTFSHKKQFFLTASSGETALSEAKRGNDRLFPSLPRLIVFNSV